MKLMIHHPDGLVYVYDGNTRYIDTKTNFARDIQTLNIANPLSERVGFWQYDMPGGYNEISHSGQYGIVQKGRWLAGENVIKAADALVMAQASRAMTPSGSI